MVTVHSDIDGGKAARSVAADSQPRFISCRRRGLKVAVLSRPFGRGPISSLEKGRNSNRRDRGGTAANN